MRAAGEALSQRKLGPYAIGRKLGSGGMATVYAARQEGSHVNRLVALKMLSAAISQDDPEHRAFMREALVATRLEHPNIVRTYDVGEIDGTMYLAMELVHGVSLSECEKALAGPAPIDVTLRIVGDVARALHTAHELEDPERGHLGVVHQDVSPHNVLVGYDGVVKLVDFGVARFGTLEGSRTESLRGKPSYASPEQINGKNIDRRTDVFALGVVAWELLTGHRLFRRETSAATYLAVLQDPIPDVREKNPAVPEPIAETIATALVRDREGRFSTAESFRRALTKAQKEAGIPDADDDAIGGWVTSLVPPKSSPAELEREIVVESGRDSHESIPPVLSPAAAQPPPEATAIDAVVPDLDVPPAQSSRRGAAASMPKVPTLDLPPASRAAAAAPAPAPAPAAPPVSARVPAASRDDDLDDLDMQIERNVSVAVAPASSRTSGAHMAARASGAYATATAASPRYSGAHGAASGLEVAYSRTAPRARADASDEPSAAMRAAGFGVAGLVAALTTFALLRVAHAPGGRDLLRLLPHAFDGSSAPESGVVSVVSLALALAVGWLGLRATPRSWALVGAGGALLLTALAMVTVTLGSTGDTPTPPDGVLLLPYLVPLALACVSAGVAGRAASLFADEGVARKAAAVPLAAIAGAVLFVAYETSKLASM